VSSPLSEAETMALASLSRSEAQSRETGIDPRVPQNVTQRAIGQAPRAES
jgi:hypothetical protein